MSAQNEQKAKSQLTAEDSKVFINAQDTLAAWPAYFVAHFLHATTPFSPPSTNNTLRSIILLMSV